MAYTVTACPLATSRNATAEQRRLEDAEHIVILGQAEAYHRPNPDLQPEKCS